VRVTTVGTTRCPRTNILIVVGHRSPKSTVEAMARALTTNVAPDAVSAVIFAVHTAAQRDGQWTAGRMLIDSACTGYPQRQLEIDTGSAKAPHRVAVLKY
jgi:hypothetical protein